MDIRNGGIEMTQAACAKKTDILIEGATIISPASSGADDKITVVDEGAIAIDGGKNVYVGRSPAPPEYCNAL